jgi:diguanylate cyclase (GGDEF)-like protein/PAS domain S-box-containing protein
MSGVLIADDDRISCKLLGSLLTKWGYQADIVYNGVDALHELLKPDAPRLAILDWMMPGIDGIQVTRKLRATHRESYTYVLLLTSKGQKEDILEGLDAGADDYLKKPFDAQELQARLRVGTRILALERDQKRAEDAMRQSETQYRFLFDSNPLPMWVFDSKTLRFLTVNKAAIRHYGFSKREFLAMTIADIRPEEDTPALLKATADRIHGLRQATIWRHRKKDGAIIDVEIAAHDLDFQGIEAVLIAAHDITKLKLAENAIRQAEEKYRAIFEDAVVGIFQITPEGCPLSINRALAQMHGYDSPEDLLAEVSNVALQLFVDPSRLDELGRVLAEKGVVRGAEVEIYRRDRTRRWVLMNLRAVRGTDGHIVLHEGTVEDITDRKVAEERVQFLAYYDVLTGLPNRTLLRDRLAQALASARRQKDKVVLLFLDLDRFKIINDSLGHSLGDLLLQDVAERLKRWAREQDTVARLGGDEFLIVLTRIKDVADAAVAAERIVNAMTAEFVVQGHSLRISCSLGLSIFPEHGADGETLIKNADAAMYCAKENGRNNFRFFTGDMNAQVLERLTSENSLRLALDKKELFLVYQPQMDIATGRITGLEALLRWQHPELGLVPPDGFIRIAENSGLIVPIGEWVIRTACSQSRKWHDEGLPAVPIAVNVSAVQFRQEGFCELIKRVLQETGLAPQNLELELTESLLLSNADVMSSVFQELKAMGLKLAIDDFGTGYSSLSYLKQFPVGKLKIDRAFIRDVAVSADDAAITTAIISMAKSLNLKVIAEGVETEAQMSFLRAHQCDEIQGYYFSKPLAADQVADKLRGTAVQHALSVTNGAK